MAILPRLAGQQLTTIDVQREETWRELPPNTPPMARHGQLLDVLVHDIGTVVELLPETPAKVRSRWNSAARTLETELLWPGVTLTIVQRTAAEESRRSVRGEAENMGFSWQFAPGSTQAWWRTGATREALEARWEDPTTALLREVMTAVAEGRPSPFDASAGLRTMTLAAEVLSALPDTPFGAPFDWSFVR